MRGRIESGALCTVAPVLDPLTLAVGDVVLCKVRGAQYLHLIKAKRGDGQFQIGNNVGAREIAAPALVNGVSQPPQDALGRDYNQDGRGLGYNVQSLLGIYAVPPYMHNGACESLACVVSDVNHRTGNGHLPDRLTSASDRAAVVRFLESIDADTPPFD